MNPAPQVIVRAIDAGVRPVSLRLPFRFGSVTLRACPQLFVRVHVEVTGGAAATGFAAEMLVPKWFDKRPGFSHLDNLQHLLDSLERASAAYRNDRPATTFGLFERHYPVLMADGQRSGATALSAAYGQAILDRAVLDALCRSLGLSFFDSVKQNRVGLGESTCMADLAGFDWNAWLATLQPLRAIAARHTVGLLDALQPVPADDAGLPVSLPAIIRRYGHGFFKIKLGGDPKADIERLGAVLQVLEQHAPSYRYTLDGNEQYADPATLGELFDAMRGHEDINRHAGALLYVEQPLPREASLDAPLAWQHAPAPMLMDEADGTLDAFARGFGLGWHGVSSKACKGLYKSIINRARCQRWNDAALQAGRPARAFMSAEDLTCQAGLAVQQDLALASLLGLSHSERNGHHYAGGFGTAPPRERFNFTQAHSDLYGANADAPALRIAQGLLHIDSLFASGFAHRADPDLASLQALADAPAML